MISKSELQDVFPWVACMLPLALVAAVGRGSIEARENFLAINLLDLVGTILGQIIPVLCAVFIGATLTIVIPAAFTARAIFVALMFTFIARTEPITNWRAFDWNRVKDLAGFGAWVSVTNIISPFWRPSIKYLLVRTLGAAAVAYYSVPMNLVGRSQIIAAALARTLFPRFARIGTDEAMQLAERAAISLAYTFGCICGPTIIFGNAFHDLMDGSNVRIPFRTSCRNIDDRRMD